MTVRVFIPDDDDTPSITLDTSTTTARTIPSLPPLEPRTAHAFHVFTSGGDDVQRSKADKRSPLLLAPAKSFSFVHSFATSPPRSQMLPTRGSIATPTKQLSAAAAAATLRARPSLLSVLSALRLPLLVVGGLLVLMVAFHSLYSLGGDALQPSSVVQTLAQWRSQLSAVISVPPVRAAHSFHTNAVEDEASPEMTVQAVAEGMLQLLQNDGQAEEEQQRQKEAAAEAATVQTSTAQHEAAPVTVTGEPSSPPSTDGKVRAGERDAKQVPEAEHVVQQQRASTEVRSPDDAALQSLRWPTEDAASRSPPPQQKTDKQDDSTRASLRFRRG